MKRTTSSTSAVAAATLLVLGALAGVGASVSPARAQSLPDRLSGVWTVEDSACSGCDPTRGPEAGARLRLGAQGYQNPFASDCLGAVRTLALAGESVAALQLRLGLPQRWLVREGHPQPAPEDVAQTFQLSCVGTEALILVLLPDGHLLMPVEASTVLRFTRTGE
jgi:hypothetical protein